MTNNWMDNSGQEELEELPQTWMVWLKGLLQAAILFLVPLLVAVGIAVWWLGSRPQERVFLPTATATVAVLQQPTDTPTRPLITAVPPTNTPQPTPTPPTEIAVGGYVRIVNTKGLDLRFRAGPGLNYITLVILPEGTVLKVLEGPQKADDFVWWRLESKDGVIGWAAQNWLQPVPPPTP
ncbi:MAG: hypothetical protein ACE5NP_01040 [Anaerolineae bacterium]